jgi:hypothetical protein
MGSESVLASIRPMLGSRAVAGDEEKSDPREIVRASGCHMGQ